MGNMQSGGALIEHCLKSGFPCHFFKQTGPKSTGREMFGDAFVKSIIEESKFRKITADDLIATATAFTAKSMALAYGEVPYKIDEIIVCGGGAYNKTLLQYLREEMPQTAVVTLEARGYSSFAKEALAFAILGNERIHNIPANVKSATGAKSYVVLGTITEGGAHVCKTV